MIKLENTEVMGWEHAIRGMRNPMNSWAKSDSLITIDYNSEDYPEDRFMDISIGTNDLNLMKKLRNAGTDHRKFMRMITVYVDITAPLYWWKEFDTYKVGTVANSCSTMHKIAEKEFSRNDFSCEHLIAHGPNDILLDDNGDIHVDTDAMMSNDPAITIEEEDGTEFYYWYDDILSLTIEVLNTARNKYIKTNDKKYWWQMIQLLPSSYNQKRTVMMNYEVLANIYKSRKNHKLDEWSVSFMDWIKTLPYSELITGEFDE